MTRALHVADGRTLPMAVLSDSTAIVGRKRAGKSNTAAVMTEEALDAGAQVIVFDPKGDWWGLRSSADGNGPGYPVVVLGGQNAMRPLAPLAGGATCDWLLDTGHSAVLDVSDLSTPDTERFCSGFLEQLRRRQKAKPRPIYLVIDEADELAPEDQRERINVLRTLGHIVWIVKRGGFVGIGTLVVTQRPASLNKNVLTQTELLVVLQTTGSQDLDAIDASVKHHIRAASRKERSEQVATLLSDIVALNKGEAVLVSGQLLRGISRLQFRRRRTFDSGATPEFGKKVRPPKVVAEVDLARLDVAMEKVVAEVKAKDPILLQQRVRELEARNKELEARPVAFPSVPKIEKVPVLKDGQLARAEKVVARIERIADNLRSPFDAELAALAKVSTDIATAIASTRSTPLGKEVPRQKVADVPGGVVGVGEPRTTAARRPDAVTAPVRGPSGPSRAESERPRPTTEPPERISPTSERVLAFAVALEDAGIELTRRSIGAWAGINPSGGYFDNILRPLRARGLVADGQPYRLSEPIQRVAA